MTPGGWLIYPTGLSALTAQMQVLSEGSNLWAFHPVEIIIPVFPLIGSAIA